MPLHPVIADAIEKGAAATPLEQHPFLEIRELIRKSYVLDLPKLPVAGIANIKLPGPAGLIPARVYTPPGKGPFPVMVWIHGGGFCFLDVDSYDFLCQAVCNKVGCKVISVDYRLAPENKFPAGVQDCAAAVRAIHDGAIEHDIDPSRIVIAGDSGGSCLVAAAVLALRDEGRIKLAGQWLIYPVLDHYSSHFPSYSLLGDGRFGLREGMMKLCWDQYLDDPSAAGDPLASPLRAKTFRGLPPTLLQVGEYDMLRDEGLAYGKRLQEDGVPADVSLCHGLNHGFYRWWSILPEADARMDEACQWLTARFRR